MYLFCGFLLSEIGDSLLVTIVMVHSKATKIRKTEPKSNRGFTFQSHCRIGANGSSRLGIQGEEEISEPRTRYSNI